MEVKDIMLNKQLARFFAFFMLVVMLVTSVPYNVIDMTVHAAEELYTDLTTLSDEELKELQKDMHAVL